MANIASAPNDEEALNESDGKWSHDKLIQPRGGMKFFERMRMSRKEII